MSYDFALEKRCSHQVLFEKAEVDSVGGLVFFEKQPSNQQSIELFINGIKIPSYGLYSYAELPISRAEPYRIRAGENDLLYLGIEQEVPRFIQMLTGPNISAAELAADLQRKIPQLIVSVVNKRVVFKSRTPFNGSAFIFPDPRWTDRTSSSTLTARSMAAFSHLGIIPGRVASGRRILPGWSLIQNPISPIVTDMALKLDTALPNTNPLIQVSYTTVAQNCRRCFGSRIEFDYDVVNGSYDTVRDTDLLAQEFDKFLFTKLGSHWKWDWLGSNLIDHIGGKSNATRSLAPAMITMDITQSYRVYENIKQQQAQKFPGQRLSDAEMPSALSNVDVQLMPDDPTVAVVSVTIRNRSRVPVPLRRVVGNPNPFYLTDGTGKPPFLPRG